MISSILGLINKEDKKNPLTDEELSEMLKVDREMITKIHLEENILIQENVEKKVLKNDLKKIIEEDRDNSIRQLTKKLNDLRYKTSRYIVETTKNEIYEESETFENVSDFVPMSFSELIGNRGSLKIQISQAKASVLYPPNGLHTLILGPSGTGKTQLAEAMYEYGIESKIFKNGAWHRF